MNLKHLVLALLVSLGTLAATGWQQLADLSALMGFSREYSRWKELA
jgi:hypothetical protein